jgi:multiple sugar transport system substrate-binding protein
MKRSTVTALGIAAAASLALSGCGGESPPAEVDETTTATEAPAPVTLTMSGWSLNTTPEFQALADGFHAENPDVTVEIIEYADGNDYDTQIIPDLAAGTAPDLLVLKNLNRLWTFQSGGQLLDVSDVAAELSDDVSGVDSYEIDGATWAVPYRQDSWVLYYNKDLFDAAGIDHPDGSWTWDDYAETAEALAAGLSDQGTKGTYQHSWQSIIQGFALAQTQGADLLSGDYGYLKPYYERAIALQATGAQQTYGTVTTGSLTYQAEFGTQKSAMLPMGSWYVATLVAQQANGEADDFEWGIAPIPQLDDSTTGTDDVPVTFGDPTGVGINPAIDEEKLEAAKQFLAWIAGEGGATVLAGLGVTPALTNDAVTETFFSLAGLPTDDLSKWAFSTHDTRPENPVAAETATVQGILNDAHSAIMSESLSVDDAIAEAEARAASEAGIG